MYPILFYFYQLSCTLSKCRNNVKIIKMEGGNLVMMQQLIFKLKMFFSKSILFELGVEPLYRLTEEETQELLDFIETF